MPTAPRRRLDTGARGLSTSFGAASASEPNATPSASDRLLDRFDLLQMNSAAPLRSLHSDQVFP